MDQYSQPHLKKAATEPEHVIRKAEFDLAVARIAAAEALLGLRPDLTADRALACDAEGKVSTAATTLDELNRLSGVRSNVQEQLNELYQELSLAQAGMQQLNAGVFGT